MAVDVDDRILRARHRMLRHDQRRARLVVADAGRRELRLAIGAGPRAQARPRSARPAAPGPCRAQRPRSTGSQQQRSAEHGTDCTAGDRAPEAGCPSASELEMKCRSQPISRILSASASAPCDASELRRDDHSSRPVIARGLQRPTRWLRTGRPIEPHARARPTPPYLVLLRAGFCLPPTLPPARCALTAPFHPYPSTSVVGLSA